MAVARTHTQSAFARSRHRGRRGTTARGRRDPQPEPDDLGSEQWDKMRMNVSLTGSYAINRGRPQVHVAFTDTGVDQTHPDIQANLDVADSTSFVTDAALPDGTPIVAEPTIQDFNGHGTWTASAVGAPINGVGISGVAPNVSIVELKTQDAERQRPAALVRPGDALRGREALRHRLVEHRRVHAEVLARRRGHAAGLRRRRLRPGARAVKYARDNGVLTIAAMGNDNLDLSDGEDAATTSSASRASSRFRPSLPGVVGVSATAYDNGKTYYSNYGQGAVDVAAPGRRPHLQTPPDSYFFAGDLVGAWSSTATDAPSLGPFDDQCPTGPCLYAGLHGTSMATPNAAGVAALIVSRYGDFSGFGRGRWHMDPAEFERRLEHSANAQPCPNPRTVDYAVPPDLFVFDYATCQGGQGNNNGFFGSGIVDAVAALTGRR